MRVSRRVSTAGRDVSLEGWFVPATAKAILSRAGACGPGWKGVDEPSMSRTGGGPAAHRRSTPDGMSDCLLAHCCRRRTLLVLRLCGAPQREPVAVRVGEIGVPGPIGIDDRLLLDELVPKRFQALELAVQVTGIDDAGSWDRARRRVGVARRPRPDNNLQILTLEAHRHELDPASRILLALFEAKGLDVEVERLVLIPNEERYIRHLLEHACLLELN